MRWHAMAGVTAMVALSSVAAEGQTVNRRAWVSGSGTDAGVCSYVAPCRTLQFAVDQIGAGGEVSVKDSGEYGPVTITKAISIIADGSLADVNVLTGTTGVTIQASTVDTIVLRGLTFSGRGSVRTFGIRAETAGRVVVDHCTFTGLATALNYSSPSLFSAVTDSFFSRNNAAIINMSSARVSLGNNVVTQNDGGLFGTFYSFGDNSVTDRNGTNTTIIPQSKT